MKATEAEKAYAYGVAAGERGDPITDLPFVKEPFASEWRRGWQDGYAKFSGRATVTFRCEISTDPPGQSSVKWTETEYSFATQAEALACGRWLADNSVRRLRWSASETDMAATHRWTDRGPIPAIGHITT